MNRTRLKLAGIASALGLALAVGGPAVLDTAVDRLPATVSAAVPDTEAKAAAAGIVCNSYKSVRNLSVYANGGPGGRAAGWYTAIPYQCLISADYGNLTKIKVPYGYHGLSSGTCYRGGTIYTLPWYANPEVNIRSGSCP